MVHIFVPNCSDRISPVSGFLLTYLVILNGRLDTFKRVQIKVSPMRLSVYQFFIYLLNKGPVYLFLQFLVSIYVEQWRANNRLIFSRESVGYKRRVASHEM